MIKTSKKYYTLVKEVNALFTQYRTKMTLRQIYYRLVAKLLIPNNMSQYKALSKLLVTARERQDVDYSMIEDRARTTIGGDHGYDSEDGFLERQEKDFRESWEYFTMPMWTNQPENLEVWVEKDALSRLVSDIARNYRVRTCPSRGYSSYTYIMDAVERLNEIDKQTTVLYLGDYDPSGLDITRDLEERLLRYGANIKVLPLALNLAQIQKYKLPPMPCKASDPRLAKFIADTGGTDAVELDALEPPILQEIVKKGITERIDADLWQKTLDEIKRIKAALKEKLDGLNIDWES